jgi:predicted nuclease of predicted toxin-antitoxin system
LKFLIDECLAVTLADMAITAGHTQSAHVARRGLTGTPDHRLMQIILNDDWTLVTRNSDDFRPRKGSASKAPCYLGQPLHAGLVCLNLPAMSARADQVAYFEVALAEIGLTGNLVNKVLEIDPGPKGGASVIARLNDFPDEAS